MKENTNIEQNLLSDLSKLIEQAQRKVAVQINSNITMLFWQVGKRINEYILQNKRAEYGKVIVVTLSQELKKTYSRNFEERNLRRMIQFAEQFPNFEIVATLSPQLSWYYYRQPNS